MRHTTMGLLLVTLLLPPTLEAQEPPVPVADTSLQTILAVIRGADPTMLHKRRGGKWTSLETWFATDVLSQYTGPELGSDRPGGLRSQAELDAFAEELVAIVLSTTPLESWGDRGDPMAEKALIALAFSSNRDRADRIPYSGAWDVVFRLYEAGFARPDHLIAVDPTRGIEHMLGLFVDRQLTQLQACQVLRMAYKHGKVIAKDDGTLGFEPGGLHSSRRMQDVFKEIRGERFVVIDTPGVAPCFWVGAAKRKG